MELRIDRIRLTVIVAFIALVLIVGVIAVATQGSSGNGASASVTTPATDTVSVSGTGSVDGVPDTLIAQFRVHDKGTSVQDALNRNSVDTHKVIAKLRGLGVALADIKTTDLSLNPEYDVHGNQNGNYDASESMTVRIHPLTKVGQILSAAATAPGDSSVNVEGLSFDIADNSALLAQARKAAFENAKAAAAQYAALSNRSLARVMTVKAVVHNPTPVYGSAGYAASTDALRKAAVPVPIRPGQKKVSVTVSVVWALN